MARTLMIIGAVLLVVGALLWLFPGAFAWFGRLPGDIRIESGQTRLFIPFTSMLLISLLLSLILNFFR